MVITQEAEVGICILQPSLHCGTCRTIQEENKSSKGYQGSTRQVRSVTSTSRQLLPNLHNNHAVLPFIERETQDANHTGDVVMYIYHLGYQGYQPIEIHQDTFGRTT